MKEACKALILTIENKFCLGNARAVSMISQACEAALRALLWICTGLLNTQVSQSHPSHNYPSARLFEPLACEFYTRKSIETRKRVKQEAQHVRVST